MSEPTYNVLFLCTGNSARSLLAEAALNRLGAPRFRAFSAGSHPTGQPNPMALRVLQEKEYETGGLRSKSWDEFAAPGAPQLDFVFTVCDSARAEQCPVWPGQPISAHWGVEDPAAFEGPDGPKHLLFLRVYYELENRIKIFASLRPESLDRLSLQKRVDEIGKTALEPGDAGSDLP